MRLYGCWPTGHSRGTRQGAGFFQVQGLQRLLEIYRDEKEWQQGLAVLESLPGSRFSEQHEKWAPIRTHFCCELAQQEILNRQLTLAKRWFTQALYCDKHSARAILLLGHLEIIEGNYSKAIRTLQKISEDNPALVLALTDVISNNSG